MLAPTEAHWFDTQCQVQDRHAVASSCGEYVPVEHCGQPYKLELATVGLYLPDGQDVHVAEPVVDLYVPGWHEVQLGTSPLMTVDVAALGIP